MRILKSFIIILGFTFPQAALSELTYTDIRASTYDSSNKGKSWTGAWIKLLNVKANGKNHILPTVEFEVGGDYNGRVDTLGFTSGRTVTKIDPRVSNKVSTREGKKYSRVFVESSIQKGKFSSFLANLKPADLETIKAICGSLSDKKFAESIIPKMISANRFGEKYKKYWSNKSRVNEIVSQAKKCNRGLGQSNSKASKFVLVRKYEVKKPELCGFALYSAFKFGRSEKIAVQTTLKELGHYNGSIDGDFGRNSCKALKSYLTSRSIQTYNNKLLKSDIDKLISIAKKKITPAATSSSPNLATSEQNGISNAKNNDDSTEGKETQTMGAADNKLGLENASLRKTVDDKERLITELQTQIEGIRKTAKSSGEEAAGLKALTSEQKKLTAALKERITALETASFLVKKELLQAEQKALEQATKIDGFQTTSTELKQRIVSLETQNKRFEISELETKKQLRSLGAEQAVLQEEKEALLTSNEALKLENGILSAKLKKLSSKSLFEGGLSGKSLVSGGDKKDETNSATNSLGGNLISKKLIKDLQDENAEFRQVKVENLKKIEALKIQVQKALNELVSAKSSIAGLKKEVNEQSAKIMGLRAELQESKAKTESKINELETLETQIVKLQSYKAQVAGREIQEIEKSKMALKTLFENKKALVLSSASNEDEVSDYITELIEELGLSPEADTFDIFLANNKSFSITLGLGTQDECNSMRDQLLSFGSIPEDSFCGDWDEYIAAFDFKSGQLIATIGKNYFEGEESDVLNPALGLPETDNAISLDQTPQHNLKDILKIFQIPEELTLSDKMTCPKAFQQVIKHTKELGLIHVFEQTRDTFIEKLIPTKNCSPKKHFMPENMCKNGINSFLPVVSNVTGDRLEFITKSRAENCTVKSDVEIKHGPVTIIQTHTGDCKIREVAFKSPEYLKFFLCRNDAADSITNTDEKRSDEANLKAKSRETEHSANLQPVAVQEKHTTPEAINGSSQNEADVALEFDQVRAEEFCRKKWTKRGILDVGMRDHCMDKQSDGYEQAKQLKQAYLYKNPVEKIGEVIEFAKKKWLTRQDYDFGMVAYEIEQQGEAYLDIVWGIENGDYTDQNFLKCSEKVIEPGSPEWRMVRYCLKK